jgi:hypothetical protein
MRSFYVTGRAARYHRALSFAVALGVSCRLALQTTPAFAQRPVAVSTFRHVNTVKSIESLDWIGEYEALEPYHRWWKEVAACAGIPLPPAGPDSVRFFYINAPDFAPIPTDKPDRMMSGVTYAAQQQIYMSVLDLRNEGLLKHEMLHQLLYWWGEIKWDDDTRLEFVRCGLEVRVRE